MIALFFMFVFHICTGTNCISRGVLKYFCKPVTKIVIFLNYLVRNLILIMLIAKEQVRDQISQFVQAIVFL